MTINERLKEFIDYNKINAPEFYRKLGVGRMEYAGWITAGRAISVAKIQIILNCYPNLNARWLLVGEGQMQEDYHDPALQVSFENTRILQTKLDHAESNNVLLSDHIVTLKERISDLQMIVQDKQSLLEKSNRKPEN
jgi:hypothetical protein